MKLDDLCFGDSNRTSRIRLLSDDEHLQLVQHALSNAKRSVWMATANVKDMRMEASVGTAARARGRYESVADGFARLATRGVEFRMLYAGGMSQAFRRSLESHAHLVSNRLVRMCPRVHLKVMIVDASLAYIGSANVTGAGLGAKGRHRRNFEMGVLIDDDVLLDVMQAKFNRIWTGGECAACRRKDVCPTPLAD